MESRNKIIIYALVNLNGVERRIFEQNYPSVEGGEG